MSKVRQVKSLKEKLKDKDILIKRILFFLLGIAATALGVSLTIISNFGAGSWDALSVGLSETFGLTVGTWVVIVAVILIIASGILLRRIPRFSTLITSFVTGAGIDLWLATLKGIEVSGIVNESLVFMAGIVVIGFGVSMVVLTELPPGPIDYFMLVLKERFKLSLGVAKTLAEGIGLILGLTFHGPIGIGSIVIVVIMGPVIQFFSKLLEPKIKKQINIAA